MAPVHRPEPRCDLCGPYTPVEAANLVMGRWQPVPTGHYCPECDAGLRVAAQALADEIDRRALNECLAVLDAKRWPA